MDNSQSVQESIQPIHEPSVSFPAPQPESGGGFPKWIFAVIGLLVVLAGGGFFLYQGSTSESSKPTPTPFVSSLTALPTPTVTVAATPVSTTSPSPLATPTSAQRASIAIEILNGTGTTGDAGVAKAAIERSGYSKITTANSPTQTATSTTLSHSSDVSAQVLAEIISALRLNFGEATVSGSTLSGTQKVQVVTGPKISSQTPSSKTSTPTPIASPATRTMSPTATATATPR